MDRAWKNSLFLSGPQMVFNPEQPLIWWVAWRLWLSLIPSSCPGRRGGPAEWLVATAPHPQVWSQGHKRSEVRHRGLIAGLYFYTAHSVRHVLESQEKFYGFLHKYDLKHQISTLNPKSRKLISHIGTIRGKPSNNGVHGRAAKRTLLPVSSLLKITQTCQKAFGTMFCWQMRPK